MRQGKVDYLPKPYRASKRELQNLANSGDTSLSYEELL